MSTTYAIHRDAQQVELALDQARGSYQRNLLIGREAISGSTLRGRARHYAARYKRSADHLIARCRAAGVRIAEERGEHNKRLLVIG
jgi:hypothetical protein